MAMSHNVIVMALFRIFFITLIRINPQEYDYYNCTNPNANCQCSKSKVDSAPGMCGGKPGCWNEAKGKTECESHGDKWLGDPNFNMTQGA